ncbi:MAG: hypothetical protein QOH33_2116 [Paraburkholderia sp.]|nr:hypothetical protein [Paraburkholderia sp.]
MAPSELARPTATPLPALVATAGERAGRTLFRQPHVPRDGHHCVPEERRRARKRRGDGEPRVDAHHAAV